MEEIRPLFVSPAEAAKLLGISRSKVYEMVRAGELAGRKFGTSVRIPLKSLEMMAAQACHLPEGE